MNAPAALPTTTAAPIARDGAGRLPPTRSATTRVRKPLISFPSPHQRDLLRLRDEPERFLVELELLVDLERPPPELRALDDDLLRLLDPWRRLPEELEPDRRDDEVCFFCSFFCSCGCGECECSRSWMSSNSAYSRSVSYFSSCSSTSSPSWITPRQAPVSTSCISM